MKYRYEQFGGIISSENPPFLAFADREFLRDLGVEESPLWQGEEKVDILTAPTEVHLSVTNRCPVGCSHCYMGSSTAGEDGEMDTETFKKAIDKLADMGIFHLAMGGGEALVREDFFELAEYARSAGLVPNLTMSGVLLTEELLKKFSIFGQANISLDGLGEHYGIYRGRQMFDEADKALTMLIEAGIPAGINCVVGRRNFDMLEEIVAYADKKGASEIEFLRFKPAGRGKVTYWQEHVTYEQSIEFWPKLCELQEKYDITLKVDCSFIPLLCYHNPDIETMRAMGIYGCEAGNVLLAGRSNGKISGCSFLPEQEISVFDLKENWQNHPYFVDLRETHKKLAEPCRSCNYLSICKGGCHAVSSHVNGEYATPDPGCPKVVEFQKTLNAKQ